MPRRQVSTVLFALLVFLGGVAEPTPILAHDEGQDEGGVVLVVGRGFLGDDELRDVVVVVRGGKIVSVATDTVSLPSDLPVVRYPDGYVTPGLVAAASDITSPHEGDESLGAGYLAVDAFDRYGDYRRLLASGVTTVHLGPGDHRLLAGQGAVAKLAGPPRSRVLVPVADLALQLGDAADEPPPLVEFPFPPSSDVPIEPAERQRPQSRLGRVLGLEEALTRALDDRDDRDIHMHALAEAWRAGRALRIAADRAVDLLAGLSFLEARDRRGYLVGGAEIASVSAVLERSRVPLVYLPSVSLRERAPDVGDARDALPTALPDFARLVRVRPDLALALGPPRSGPTSDLRLAAVVAHRAGLPRARALAAISTTPARLLGVGARVGRIAAGHDADLVVWNRDPLSVSAQPIDVFVGGRRAWQPATQATVIRAGTIWMSPEQQLHDGEILLEDGRVAAVGRSVPHPPHARFVDAGIEGFVAPGFIDARGHLGLRGDRSRLGTSSRLARLVGVPDVPEHRVASAGITTVLLGPVAIGPSGSPAAAIKTWGRTRGDRVIRDVAAVLFEVDGDPLSVEERIQRTLGRGKKYVQSWKKYEKELEEWRKKKESGDSGAKEKTDAPEERVEEIPPDPVTGVWEGTATGGPLTDPRSGQISLTLSGTLVEGRIIEPAVPMAHRIVGTFQGNRITGTIETDMELPAPPRLDVEIGDDTLRGTLTVLDIVIQLEGRRISKEAVEYKLSRRRATREDGRPVPPKIDPGLEPIRALLEKEIPAVVRVSGRDRMAGILDLFLEKEKLPLLLLEGGEARFHSDRLASANVGVILPVAPLATVRGVPFHPSDHLARRGVHIAFQSAAGDGARDLPSRVLFSVERGLAADAALAALTTFPARMYHLDDRIGTLETGRDADVLLFRGHPFRDGGRLERVWINGEEVTP